jgi:hypothetical protein
MNSLCTGIKFPVHSAKPLTEITGFNLFHADAYKRNKQSQKEKIPTGLYKKAIIG